jgi:hypothetical protein
MAATPRRRCSLPFDDFEHSDWANWRGGNVLDAYQLTISVVITPVAALSAVRREPVTPATSDERRTSGQAALSGEALRRGG